MSSTGWVEWEIVPTVHICHRPDNNMDFFLRPQAELHLGLIDREGKCCNCCMHRLPMVTQWVSSQSSESCSPFSANFGSACSQPFPLLAMHKEGCQRSCSSFSIMLSSVWYTWGNRFVFICIKFFPSEMQNKELHWADAVQQCWLLILCSLVAFKCCHCRWNSWTWRSCSLKSSTWNMSYLLTKVALKFCRLFLSWILLLS